MLKKLSVLALSAVILTGCSWSHVKTVNAVDAGNITKVCVVPITTSLQIQLFSR